MFEWLTNLPWVLWFGGVLFIVLGVFVLVDLSLSQCVTKRALYACLWGGVVIWAMLVLAWIKGAILLAQYVLQFV